MTIGSDLIAVERNRQIDDEGWDEAHDNEHHNAELVLAGICYANTAAMIIRGEDITAPNMQPQWPWAPHWWKPNGDPVRNLVKAGALVAAEIDRLVRLQTEE